MVFCLEEEAPPPLVSAPLNHASFPFKRFMMRGPLIVGALVLLSSAATRPVASLETDQYYTWGRDLQDSTDVINAKFTLEMQRAISSFDTPPEECVDIAIRFRKRMRFLLFHHVQMWAMNTSLVPRIPVDADEDIVFRRTNLYHIHGVFDPGMWMTFTPTVEVNGVRIGTDKLSHFVSSGWTYYSTYRRALKNGQTPEAAETAAVERGLLEEKLILGRAAAGILSLADLEANFQGMHFYLDLCHGEDPMLVRAEGSWKLSRPVDLRSYVHPGWDESYRTSIFTKGRWKKVEPGLLQYCPLRDDPQVVEMHRRYRAAERTTLVQEMVAKQVAAGTLPDPHGYSLDANCPPLDPEPATGATLELPNPPPEEARVPQVSAAEWTERIIAHELDTERRTVRAAALRLSYPQLASASIGWIFTRQPRDYDCRTPCDLWGMFTQIEPGLGGGKASFGFGRVIGEHRKGPAALSSVYLALGVKGTVLHSWGGHSPIPSGQTYVGPEFEFSIARVNMGIGALGRISGDQGRTWIITGYLGWGF
jgi:hypothetical protein